MPEPLYLRVAAIFALVKGAMMASVLVFLDISFWKQLIIVVVSASIGAAGSITASIIALRSVRREHETTRDTIHEARDELKGEVGDKRNPE